MLLMIEIGILPYLYFLLLTNVEEVLTEDWNTAVFILPSTPVEFQLNLT